MKIINVVGARPNLIKIAAYRNAMSGNWRMTQIPPLWDGKASGRIVETMLKKLNV